MTPEQFETQYPYLSELLTFIAQADGRVGTACDKFLHFHAGKVENVSSDIENCINIDDLAPIIGNVANIHFAENAAAILYLRALENILLHLSEIM